MVQWSLDLDSVPSCHLVAPLSQVVPPLGESPGKNSLLVDDRKEVTKSCKGSLVERRNISLPME
jgi:hypothetical protein